MRYETTFAYTPDFAAKVYRQLLARKWGEYVILSVVLAIAACYGIARGWQTIFWSYLLGIISVHWLSWSQGAYRSRAAATLGAGESLQITVTEEGCQIVGSGGSQQFTWVTVTRLVQLSSAIVFERGLRSAPVPIPLTAVTPEVLSRIRDWVHAGGGRIT